MKLSINSRLYFIGLVLLMFSLIQTGCKTKAADNNKSALSADLSIPPLMERKGELAKAPEWEKTKEKLSELMQKITRDPKDIKSRLQVAVIYMAEARITGEHPYYYPAIIKITDGVIALDPTNFEALVYKAAAKLSQHAFGEALEIGEQARKLNPDNAYIYGVLVDANVEMGNYEAAVKMSDKMQALKPSLESYARASYLREIYGDYAGSIEAMQMAVKAGMPGSEPWSWSKKTLGLLFEKTNKWVEAKKEYESILVLRPGYAYALAGLASVEKQSKNYGAALELLEKASGIMPEFSFQEEMAGIYELKGDKEKAKEKYAAVVSMLNEDKSSGHDVSLEMCRVYTKAGDFANAIKEGSKEYEKRQANIDVNKELAWAYYNNKEQDKAVEHINIALKTGSQDPDLLKKAGIIKKTGE